MHAVFVIFLYIRLYISKLGIEVIRVAVIKNHGEVIVLPSHVNDVVLLPENKEGITKTFIETTSILKNNIMKRTNQRFYTER